METFEEYKKGIDSVTREMKDEIFEFLNNVDFTTFESVKKSISESLYFEGFEDRDSAIPPILCCYLKFRDNNVTLKYNHDDKILKILDLDNYHNYIEVKSDIRLLRYISTSKSSLDMTEAPLIHSDLLNEDIEAYLLSNINIFSSIIVYNSNINISDQINSNIFFVSEKRNIVIELNLNFDSERKIKINKFNLYRAGKKELHQISKYTTQNINLTAIKYIFENIQFVEMESIGDIIEDEGIDYFNSDDFENLVGLKILF